MKKQKKEPIAMINKEFLRSVMSCVDAKNQEITLYEKLNEQYKLDSFAYKKLTPYEKRAKNPPTKPKKPAIKIYSQKSLDDIKDFVRYHKTHGNISQSDKKLCDEIMLLNLKNF